MSILGMAAVLVAETGCGLINSLDNNNNSNSSTLAVTPNLLNFTTSAAQTFVVSGGSGTVTPSTTCGTSVTLTEPQSGAVGTWSVTPVAASAQCAVNFVDSNSNTATVAITVQVDGGFSVSPTSLTFTSTTSQTFLLSGGSGTIDATNTCGGIATVTAPSSGADGTWTVEPIATGNCKATFTDGTNTTVAVGIEVNLAASTSTMTWEMELAPGCSTGVYLKFFDETANLEWPSSSEDYVLNTPGQTETYSLLCTTGDNVCFGASLSPNSDQEYWGVGVLNDQSCPSCCVQCTNTSVQPPAMGGGGCAVKRNSRTWSEQTLRNVY
ncbi:MAG TPA: hypothetical protein VF753_12150 [Terriglobales bacterium]